MERAEILREYAEKVLTLHEEFGDVIARKFAPFDTRNYETPDSATKLSTAKNLSRAAVMNVLLC